MAPSSVSQVVATVSKRYVISERLRAIARALAWAWIGTSCLYGAVHLLWGPPPLWGAAAAFAFIAGIAAYFFFTPRPAALAVARLIDSRLDLMDRISTALEYQEVDTGLASWLRDDAEQKARFVDPRRVAPLPPRPGRRAALLALAAAASALVWLTPLPAGVLFSQPALAPPGEGGLVTEEEIFARASALLDQTRAIQTPEMQRIQRDLAALQAGLRERSLPRDEALALLELLERRVQAALQAAGAEAGSISPGQADLERLQDLASRLVAAVESAPSSGAAQEITRQIRQLSPSLLDQNPELERLLERLESSGPLDVSDDLLNAANRLRDSIDQSLRESRLTEGEDGDTGSTGAGAATGEGIESDRAAPGGAGDGAGGQPGEDGGEAEGSGLQPADSTDQPGSDEVPAPGTGSGARPGEGPGGDTEGAFTSPGQLRELYYLPGSILDGPIRRGTVQTNLNPPGDDWELPAGANAVMPSAPVDADAVLREQIPLAYRETVRRYFQSLEPNFE